MERSAFLDVGGEFKVADAERSTEVFRLSSSSFPGAALLVFATCPLGLERCTFGLRGFAGSEAVWMIAHLPLPSLLHLVFKDAVRFVRFVFIAIRPTGLSTQ
jgi:hypothetical protein